MKSAQAAQVEIYNVNTRQIRLRARVAPGSKSIRDALGVPLSVHGRFVRPSGTDS